MVITFSEYDHTASINTAAGASVGEDDVDDATLWTNMKWLDWISFD